MTAMTVKAPPLAERTVPKKVKAKRTLSTVGYDALMLVLCLGIVLPLLSVALAALNPPGTLVEGMQWPADLTFESFTHAWVTADFGSLLLTSVLMCVVVVPISMALATLAGYGLAQLKVPGSRVIFLALLAGLTLPAEAAIIPLYYNLQSVGLVNSYLGVFLSLIGLYMPFGVFWMRSYFLSMPIELREAAEIDGASNWRVLWQIMLPNAGPALTTLSVLFFTRTWNQFLIVLVLIQDPNRRNAPAGLGFFEGIYSDDIPQLAAATIIVIIPVVVVYLFMQRHFIKGMLEGAVKG